MILRAGDPFKKRTMLYVCINAFSPEKLHDGSDIE